MLLERRIYGEEYPAGEDDVVGVASREQVVHLKAVFINYSTQDIHTNRKYLVEGIEHSKKEKLKKAHMMPPTPFHSRHWWFLFCKFLFSKG